MWSAYDKARQPSAGAHGTLPRRGKCHSGYDTLKKCSYPALTIALKDEQSFFTGWERRIYVNENR
jgi:hypothetical protein